MKPIQAGQIISGKYRIERLLGEGAMGVVFEATQVALRRRVALKFLNEEAGKDKDAVRRFFREARAAAALRSEHAVRIVDVADEPDNAYIVMECLEGEDLARLLKQRNKLSPQEAIEFVLQAGEALAEAHIQGIVHRDLKPANLFVTRRADGSPFVKVVDFGISKLVDREEEQVAEPEGEPLGKDSFALTNPQRMMGSPLYMAPEQMLGAATVDARADVWSLGVILYELMSGVPPFSGQTLVDLCMHVVNEPHPPLRTLVPQVPEELEATIDLCLRKDPSQRPPSVAVLAAKLARFAGPNGMAAASRIAAVQGVAVVFGEEQNTTQTKRGFSRWLLAGGIAVVASAATFALVYSARRDEANPAPNTSATSNLQTTPKAEAPMAGLELNPQPPLQPLEKEPQAAEPKAAERPQRAASLPARGARRTPNVTRPAPPPARPAPANRRGRIVTDL